MDNPVFKTDFLFPESSFAGGVGSIINLAGSYFDINTSETPEQADVSAIRSDWGVVGQDLKSALDNLARNEQK